MNDVKQEVLEFLKSNFVMNLAFTEGSDPHISVLLYAIDDDFNIYFGTHTDAYKTPILKKNPKVSLNIWEHENMMVQINGEVREVVGEEDKKKALDKLAEATNKDDNFWPPLFRIGGLEYIVFKIKPKWMRKLDLKTDTITQNESPFTEIDLLRN